ncbi:hypothetical protein ACQJBY_059755 [Aegilops geniculata]
MEIAHRNREPFNVMSGRKRPRPLEILRQRFQSELAAVRRLLAEAATVLPASSPSAPRVRVRQAEEPPAKKRKASPPVPVKKMTPKERNQLYGDLGKLAKLSESHVLPAHILELLKKHSRRGICDDYIEIEMHAVQDAALVEMQKQLDKFARESKNPSTRHRHKQMRTKTWTSSAASPLCRSGRHQCSSSKRTRSTWTSAARRRILAEMQPSAAAAVRILILLTRASTVQLRHSAPPTPRLQHAT